MSLRPSNSWRRAGLVVVLMLLTALLVWVFTARHDTESISGRWVLKVAPDTSITLELHDDGTGSETQYARQAGLRSPQSRQFRWFVDDKNLYTYSTDPLPWYGAQWMFETYLTYKVDPKERLTIISVTPDRLIVDTHRVQGKVTYRRAWD